MGNFIHIDIQERFEGIRVMVLNATFNNSYIVGKKGLKMSNRSPEFLSRQEMDNTMDKITLDIQTKHDLRNNIPIATLTLQKPGDELRYSGMLCNYYSTGAYGTFLE